MTENSKLTYPISTPAFAFLIVALSGVCYYFWMVLLVWDVSDRWRGEFTEFVAPVVAPWISIIAANLLVLWLRSRHCALQVSADGIHSRLDTREVIPWSAIENMRLTNFLSIKRLKLALKSGYRVGDFGTSGFLPLWVQGRLASSRHISFGPQLNKTVGRIANDINSFPHKPKGLFVE